MTLVRYARATQPQSPWLVPQSTKKKKENRTRARQIKAVGTGLEGSMDWTCIISSELIEEEEMSSLVVGFAAQMRKPTVGSKDETTPKSYGKRSKWSSLDEEARKDWAIILADPPDRAFNDQLVLEGAPNEASAPLEKGITVEWPSNIDEIGDEAPLGVATAPMLPPRLIDIEPNRKRLPDRVLLSPYVQLQERIHPSTGMVAPDLECARVIIHRWSPFNQEKSLVEHMRDLYPNYFQVPVEARAKHYTIPFSVYIDKEAFQSVVEDGMLIRNHDDRLSWYVLIFST